MIACTWVTYQCIYLVADLTKPLLNITIVTCILCSTLLELTMGSAVC